jgi:hypothetical protein
MDKGVAHHKAIPYTGQTNVEDMQPYSHILSVIQTKIPAFE